MSVYTEAELIAIRRALHQIPEIGLKEIKTTAYLLDIIQNMKTSYMDIRLWHTGMLVFVKGSQPAKTIGWRTDIDGLPITEEVISSFQSQHQGYMHACGHDIHMTIALGILKHLAEQQPIQNYVVLFQAAEENEAGGMLMYQDHLFDGVEPDVFYGLHVSPDLSVGTVGTRIGTLFASTCEINLTLTGKGGHAAFPHLSNDMIVAAAQFIQQAQTVVSRSVDPIQGAVVTFGTIHAGTTNNVIPGEAVLSGTIRTLTNDMNELTQRRIREIADGIAISYNCQVDLRLDQKGYIPVVNTPEATTCFIDFVNNQSEFQFIKAHPAMTGEDFGYLLDKFSGTMFWLGVDSPFGLHHPQFEPKETAIFPAVSMISSFLAYLDTIG